MGLVFFLGSGGRSQWSTLESGPLARSERPGKGRELGKVVEPVVHSPEWTTSSQGRAPFLHQTQEKKTSPNIELVFFLNPTT